MKGEREGVGGFGFMSGFRSRWVGFRSGFGNVCGWVLEVGSGVGVGGF